MCSSQFNIHPTNQHPGKSSHSGGFPVACSCYLSILHTYSWPHKVLSGFLEMSLQQLNPSTANQASTRPRDPCSPRDLCSTESVPPTSACPLSSSRPEPPGPSHPQTPTWAEARSFCLILYTLTAPIGPESKTFNAGKPPAFQSVVEVLIRAWQPGTACSLGLGSPACPLPVHPLPSLLVEAAPRGWGTTSSSCDK